MFREVGVEMDDEEDLRLVFDIFFFNFNVQV